MIPTSKIEANHNREEVETRVGDNLFVDLIERIIVLSPRSQRSPSRLIVGVL
jgi:hypothetical protein